MDAQYLEHWRKKRQQHRKSAHRAQVDYERAFVKAIAEPSYGSPRADNLRMRKLELLIAIERSRGSKVTIRRMEALYKQQQLEKKSARIIFQVASSPPSGRGTAMPQEFTAGGFQQPPASRLSQHPPLPQERTQQSEYQSSIDGPPLLTRLTNWRQALIKRINRK